LINQFPFYETPASLTISKDEVVIPNTAIINELYVQKATVDDLDVTNVVIGTASVHTLDVSGELTVDGDATFNGPQVTIENDLQVKGDVVVNQTLYVQGDVSFETKLTVDGDVSFQQHLYVGGDASFNGDAIFYGDVSINGNLTSYSHTTITDISINGDTTIQGSWTQYDGDVSFNGGFLAQTDSNSPSDQILLEDVSGTGSYNSTLAPGTFNSAHIWLAHKPGSTNTWGGETKDVGYMDISAANTIYFSGDTSFNRTLTVLGDVSFHSGLSVFGDTSLNTLYVVGKTTFQGDVSMNGDLGVDGDTSLNTLYVVNKSHFIGDVSMNGDLGVNGYTNIIVVGYIIDLLDDHINK